MKRFYLILAFLLVSKITFTQCYTDTIRGLELYDFSGGQIGLLRFPIEHLGSASDLLGWTIDIEGTVYLLATGGTSDATWYYFNTVPAYSDGNNTYDIIFIAPLTDLDGDGYCAYIDCDDTEATIHPGAIEIECDGIDNDCDSLTPDDATAPVPDIAELPDITDECSVTTLTAPTATDNCTGVVTGTHDALLPITAPGTTLITWTYNDGNGNVSTQQQNVIISDNQAPVPDVADLPDITEECTVTTLTAPTATDNCAGVVTGTNDALLPITTPGTTIITWTYNDGNGNVSTQQQNVIISDTQAPVPDVADLPDIIDECSITTLTAPTATDNCAGVVTGTSDALLPITTPGTTIITWTYNDGKGNASSQQQNVIISDTQAPVPDVADLPDITEDCSVTTLTAPTATDNCAGVVTGTSDALLPIIATGTTIITWTYNDGKGNASTQQQNVIISDAEAPVPDVADLPDITDECSVTTLTAPTATDNCAGVVTGTSDALLPITASGTTIITWTYNDGKGNVSTQQQNVIISDAEAPVPDVADLPDITDECSVSELIPPTATDNCLGTIIGTHNFHGTFPITAQGISVITWTYIDNHYNITTQQQNVIIDDVSAPVPNVTNLPDIRVDCEVTTLTAPTATDNCDGTIIGTHNVTLPLTNQGTTVVTWTYQDSNENISTQLQNIIIDDIHAPVPNVSVLPNVTAQCQVSNLTAPTATDLCAGVVTGTRNVTLPIVNQGTTVVTWTYEDDYGNTSTQHQNVVIDDITAPVANVAELPDITAECSVSALTPPTATDNCEGTITGTHNVTLPITSQGTTVVTWTYNDGNGNISTQHQNVVIDDITAPVADVAELPDITDECSISELTSPTATDNCEGTITGTHNVTLPITSQGTTVVTWTYDDGNGNISTQHQNVVIDDITAPVADVAELPDITAECSVSELTAPTATDNCEGAITGTHNVTLPITSQGTTVVTWTYDDGNGNTSTQQQNVVIDDITEPVADASELPDLTDACSINELTAPTATDNCVGIITGTCDVLLPIMMQGTTVITWHFDDGHGNIATQLQNVTITDTIAPVPDSTILPELEVCVQANPIPPTASDSCAGTISGTADVTFPITSEGATLVTWTYDDGHGNTATQTQNIIVHTVNTVVILTEGVLTADAVSAIYQWLDCDDNYSIIEGETSRSFTPTELPGRYAVEVTENSCADTSVCVQMEVSGIEDSNPQSVIFVYPNPNNGQFNIRLSGLPVGVCELRIIDARGSLIYSRVLKDNSYSYFETITIPSKEPGIYHIGLYNKNGLIKTIPVIIE